jgi:hypothetical protein
MLEKQIIFPFGYKGNHFSPRVLKHVRSSDYSLMCQMDVEIFQFQLRAIMPFRQLNSISFLREMSSSIRVRYSSSRLVREDFMCWPSGHKKNFYVYFVGQARPI